MSAFCLLLVAYGTLAYAGGPYGAGAEVSSKIGSHVELGATLVHFTVDGKTFGFDVAGTVLILSNGDLLYESNGGIYYDDGGKFVGPPVQNTVLLPDFINLPAADAKIAFTEWVLSSGLWALERSGLIDFTITPADLPAGAPLKLNTDDLFWLGTIPGLSKYPHMNLTISVTPSTKWPTLSIQPNSVLVAGPLGFSLAINIVKGATPVVAEAVVLDIELTVTMTAAVSLPHPTEIDVVVTITKETDSETLSSSKVGDVVLATFKSIIELAFGFIKIPTLPIPVPDSFSVKSLQLISSTGYVVILADLANTTEVSGSNTIHINPKIVWKQ